MFLLQLTASGRDVIRSRDTDRSFSLASGQQVRAKIVYDLLASERDYVKLLHDIVEVDNNKHKSL